MKRQLNIIGLRKSIGLPYLCNDVLTVDEIRTSHHRDELITAFERSCWKVLFSQLSVRHLSTGWGRAVGTLYALCDRSHTSIPHPLDSSTYSLPPQGYMTWAPNPFPTGYGTLRTTPIVTEI